VSTFGLGRLLRSRNGNVSMMYALVAPVLVFGGGAAVDYGRAAQIHTKLNAAADAAALAALTPAMLQQSATVAQAAAVSMFDGLTNGISGLTAGATQVTVHRHGRFDRAGAECRSQLLDLGQYDLRPGVGSERVAHPGRLAG
jgi:Flp pilus assembly protein TadG